jgi:peptide/nickel transport system substrate-binding protein
MRNTHLRALAVAALSVGLVACGSNAGNAGHVAVPSGRPQAAGSAPAVAPSIGVATSSATPAAAKVKTGGTLTVGIASDAVNLDSARASTTSDGYIISQVAEPLFLADENFQVVGNLVDKVDNPDDTTYVFHLHPGIKFQDGTDFNAEAVRWNLQRHIDDPKSVRHSDVAAITGMQVVDDLTVRITLNVPFAPFLSKLTGGAGYMYSPAAVQKLGDKLSGDLTDAGTGPFRFISWQRDNQIVLERNPNYWRKDENGIQYPYLDRLVLQPIKDKNQRLNALKAGDADFIEAPPPKDIKSLQSSSDLVYKQVPGISTDVIALETEKEPFNDKLVREALSYALDRSTIVNTVYFGTRVPADTEIPGNLTGAVTGPYMQQDLGKAKDLLNQAGKDHVSFALIYPANSPLTQQIGELIKDEIKDAGFDVQLQPIDFPALVDSATKGNYQAAMLGWNGGVDADNFSFPLLQSKASFNIPHFQSPELDALLQQARQTLDPEQRTALYKQIMAKAADEEPFIVYNWGVFQQTTRKTVQNFPLGPSRFEQLFKVWKSA